MMSIYECAECEGEGMVYYPVGFHGEGEEITCPMCEGEGNVSNEGSGGLSPAILSADFASP